MVRDAPALRPSCRGYMSWAGLKETTCGWTSAGAPVTLKLIEGLRLNWWRLNPIFLLVLLAERYLHYCSPPEASQSYLPKRLTRSVPALSKVWDGQVAMPPVLRRLSTELV